MVGFTMNLISETHIYVVGPTIRVRGNYVFMCSTKLLNNHLYIHIW